MGTTMYQLGYVRQLDMGSVQRAAQRELPHIGPEWTQPISPSVTPGFAGNYCTDREAMTRLTAVPLHKQKAKLMGAVSLPYQKKEKRSRHGFRGFGHVVSTSSSTLPRPVTASSAPTAHASSRLSSLSAASVRGLQRPPGEETVGLFRPRSAAQQEGALLLKQAALGAASKGAPAGRKLHLLPPNASGLSNERKLRLLQGAHMTESHAAVVLQRCLRGKTNPNPNNPNPNPNHVAARQ